MKRCPECRKDYLDDSILYCLDDGAPLVQGSITSEPATAIMSGISIPVEDRTLTLRSDTTAENVSSESSVSRSRTRLGWIVGAALLAVAAGFVGWSLSPREQTNSHRLVMNLVPPNGLTVFAAGTLGSVVELSPDGTSLLIRADDHLWMRKFDSAEFTKIPATAGIRNQPAWKDDQTVSFGTSREDLVSVRLPDGPPEVIPYSSTQGFSRGRSWSTKGTALLSMFDRLEMVGTDGQVKRVQTPTGMTEAFFFSPKFIPGTEDFIVHHRARGEAIGEVLIATLADGAITNVSTLMKNATSARFTPAGGGHLLYVKNDNLYAQRLDLGSRSLAGEPKLVAKGVASQPSARIALADFSVSDNGVIAWRSGRAGTSQVTVFDRTGKQLEIAGPQDDVSTIAVSPTDASRVLAVLGGSGSFLAEVGQDEKVAVPPNVDWYWWSHDGKLLYGLRDNSLVTRPVDGGSETVVGSLSWDGPKMPMDLSPDGRSLLLSCGNAGPLCVSTLSDEGVFGAPVQISTSNDSHLDASFSPDGKSVVYSITDAGIYVQPFPGPGRRVEISPRGQDPVWRRDGKEILYAGGLSAVMSVSVSGSSGALSFGTPQELFDGLRRPLSSVTLSRSLGVSADGSRIYWAQGVEQPGDGLINVMFGFFNEK